MDFGPSYRVYYGREGRTIIILLGGGSQRRQDADIAAAMELWKLQQTIQTQPIFAVRWLLSN